MSAFFEVTVIEKESNVVKLRLRIINPDQEEFHEEENVAFQFLLEPIFYNMDFTSSLGKKVPMKNLADEEWILENTEKYVESSKLIGIKNYPPESTDDIPEAEMIIEVTSSKWVEHLKPGMTWQSAAYDMD